MRPKNKQELKEEFVGVSALSVAREAILAAKLAEFTGPVGQDAGKARVGQGGVTCPARAVVTTADCPTPVKPVIRSRVETERTLNSGWLLTFTPDEFRPHEEIVINGPAQSLPAQRSI